MSATKLASNLPFARAESVADLRAIAAANPMPVDFGEGWMTKSARELARFAVGFCGFEMKELVRRLVIASERSRGERINARTVENIMGEMSDAHRRQGERS